ncbi:MAG: hypothetical protein MUF54_16590 [Polyangiaceae bacterium]|jgi:hypothetical protein|nr:hypothetical protein [Polyangiaceae bacterium]
MTLALSLDNTSETLNGIVGARPGTPATSTAPPDDQDPFRPQASPPVPSRLLLDQQRAAARSESELVWNEDIDAANVWVLPRKTQRAVRFQLLQQWEGTVAEVDGDGFIAHLRDKRDPDASLERATITLDELADHDLPLVEPGAIFDWTIGYLTQPHGQKTTESTIVFRRMPRWSARDLQRVKRDAAEFDDLFDCAR